MIICLIMAVPMIILAIIFAVLKEKGAMLISGFNTLPKAEREKHDKAKMSVDMRNSLFIWSFIDAQSGNGAAQWVGQKPNIINVAVSRAKYRLGVIGDYDLWKNIPNVQVVCKYLKLHVSD